MHESQNMKSDSYETVQYKDMDDGELEFTSSMFAALGNSTRLRVAELLVHREYTVNEVAQTLKIQQPNASLNLATLQRAGIAKVSPRGAQRFYSLRGPRIVQILNLARTFHKVHAGTIQSEQAVDQTEGGLDREAAASNQTDQTIVDEAGTVAPVEPSSGASPVNDGAVS